ncbi:LcrR family type III secretion system chaperone [Arsenophonus nasoniae]|uniref:LcrR family type III secretion system chaperone n=1 Tax=Arsenophonus nasoniae TaxID=638 RepID=UPI003879839C
MNSDPLNNYFKQQGYFVAPYYWKKSHWPIGYFTVINNIEIAWRCEGSRIWILMLRRKEKNLGLGNAFKPLYILADIVKAVLGEHYTLYGQVNVLSRSPLTQQRLQQFYQRWTGAIEVESGWFELAVGKVISLKDNKIKKILSAN